jgi:hypothetical protein
LFGIFSPEDRRRQQKAAFTTVWVGWEEIEKSNFSPQRTGGDNLICWKAVVFF